MNRIIVLATVLVIAGCSASPDETAPTPSTTSAPSVTTSDGGDPQEVTTAELVGDVHIDVIDGVVEIVGLTRPQMSADGNVVAGTHRFSGEDGEVVEGIVILVLESGDARFVPTENGIVADISDNGSTVLIRERERVLSAYSMATDEQHPLAEGELLEAAISGDGSTVVWARDSAPEIHIVNMVESRPTDERTTPLSLVNRRPFGVRLDDAGQTAVFIVEPEGEAGSEVWSLDLGGAQPTRLTNGSRGSTSVGIAGSGTISFTSYAFDLDPGAGDIDNQSLDVYWLAPGGRVAQLTVDAGWIAGADCCVPSVFASVAGDRFGFTEVEFDATTRVIDAGGNEVASFEGFLRGMTADGTKVLVDTGQNSSFIYPVP